MSESWIGPRRNGVYDEDELGSKDSKRGMVRIHSVPNGG